VSLPFWCWHHQNKINEKGGDVQWMIDGVLECGGKKMMIPCVADLAIGMIVTIVPVEGWFQIGLAAYLSGIGKTLVGSYYSN
jgi:hypothetical protein